PISPSVLVGLSARTCCWRIPNRTHRSHCRERRCRGTLHANAFPIRRAVDCRPGAGIGARSRVRACGVSERLQRASAPLERNRAVRGSSPLLSGAFWAGEHQLHVFGYVAATARGVPPSESLSLGSCRASQWEESGSVLACSTRSYSTVD